MGKYGKYLAWLIPVFLVWVIYANTFFSSIFTGRENFSWLVILFHTIIYLLIWAFVSWFISRRKKKAKPLTIWFFFVLVFGSALFFLLTYIAHKQYLIVTTPQNDSISIVHIIVSISKGILIGIVLVAIQYYLNFQSQWRAASLKAANLEKENSKAQLHALQSQVNPHFLFNNLNTLQSLIDDKNEAAQNFLIELSDLYRNLLKTSQNEVVLLEDEISSSEKFNYLMKQRFGENYNCEYKIDETEIKSKFLPPFSIQMLLENAVKHNRIDDSYPLHCKVYKEGKFLVIENNLQERKASYPSNNIGLENLRSRYSILSNQEIEVYKDKDVFKVKIPLLSIKQYD